MASFYKNEIVLSNCVGKFSLNSAAPWKSQLSIGQKFYFNFQNDFKGPNREKVKKLLKGLREDNEKMSK